MKIKSFFLLSGITMLGLYTSAQTTTTATPAGGTTFGLRAGVNFQNLNGKSGTGDRLENSLKPGFHIGGNAEIPIATDYYVQPGVLFSTKGAKLNNSNTKINLSYVEVPVNFLYKPVLGTGRLLLGFGPYVGFAVGGKVKPENGNDVDIKFKNSVTTNDLVSGSYYTKRFDAGGNLLAGYEMSNRLSFQLNAQLGMLKINPKNESATTDKSTLKNTGFGISAGYRF